MKTVFGDVPFEQDEDGNWVVQKGKVEGASTPIGAAGQETRVEQRYQKNLAKVSGQQALEDYSYGDGVKKFQEIQDASAISNIHEHAKAESTDMVLGIKDMINALEWKFTDDPEKKAALIQEHFEVQEARDNMKEFYTPLELGTFGSKVGKMFPYLVTGGVEAGIGRAVISPLATIEKGASALGKGVSKLASKIPDSAVSKIDPALVHDVKTVGDMAKTGYKSLNELPVIKSMRKEGSWTDEPYLAPYKETLIGTGVTGSIEGSIQEDSGPIEGAVTNVLANMLGKRWFSGIRAMPNENSEVLNNLIDEGVARGYTLTPGVKLGNRFLQQNEAKMAGAAQQAQVMHRYKLRNQEVTNREVWDWLGLPKAEDGNHIFTPEILANQRGLLKGQYNDITSNSTGHFTSDGMDQLKALQGYYAEKPGIFSKEIFDSISGHIDQFRMSRQTARGPDGKYRKGQFSGRQFQEWDDMLRSDVNAAFAAGKPEVAYALKDVRGVLKDALTDGMELFGSKAEADDWTKLDTQWYMFNTLEEVGLDARGNVSLDGLLDNFMSTDRKNFLENKSIVTNPLHGMAKLRGVDKESAQLGGTAVEGIADRGEIPQMTRGGDATMPMIPLLKHKAYMGKYGPSFGTEGRGMGDPGVYAMAADQGLNVHEGLYNLAEDVYGEGVDAYEGYENWREDRTEDRLTQDIEEFNNFVSESIINWMFSDEEEEQQQPTGQP